MTLNQLYDIARNNNINVCHFPLSPIKSISVPGYIGIDIHQINTVSEERECLAHELGHCMKNVFYTGASTLELRTQKEYRADKWAIQTLIPFEELLRVLQSGRTEAWEIAEHFEVSECFVNKALNLYEYKLICCRKTE